MRHDPLPWTYTLTDSMEEGEDAFVIQSPDGDVAEIMSPTNTADGNATLICRAVNCHEKLLASCETMRTWLIREGGWSDALEECGINAAIAAARA